MEYIKRLGRVRFAYHAWHNSRERWDSRKSIVLKWEFWWNRFTLILETWHRTYFLSLSITRRST